MSYIIISKYIINVLTKKKYFSSFRCSFLTVQKYIVSKMCAHLANETLNILVIYFSFPLKKHVRNEKIINCINNKSLQVKTISVPLWLQNSVILTIKFSPYSCHIYSNIKNQFFSGLN